VNLVFRGIEKEFQWKGSPPLPGCEPRDLARRQEIRKPNSQRFRGFAPQKFYPLPNTAEGSIFDEFLARSLRRRAG
jgi:hypothetical protein